MSARRRKTRQAGKAVPDPYLTFLIFIAVGLGSFRLEIEVRLTALWTLLLLLSLVEANARRIEFRYSLVELGRGALIGAAISLPIFFLARSTLNLISLRLFPMPGFPALFRTLVLLAAPAEEVFFRGVVQRKSGLVLSSFLYGLAGVVFFLPVSDPSPLVVLAAIFAAMGVMGFVYGYVCERYGLSAAIACHATVNSVLLFLPPLLAQVLQ
ncbi:MAG: lysostaphin resistance A-like protein [Anaerolineae bacterium]